MKSGIALAHSEKKRLQDLLDSFQKVRVLVVGDFILDQFIWGSVDRISPEAPVPVVHVQRESYMPGGSLNVGNNIRALHGIVYPCGVVGRDREGRMLVRLIRREKIETTGIVYATDRPTCVKTRVIAHSQQVVRFDREKTHDLAPELKRKIFQFVQKSISSVDVVLIEDYGKGVIQPRLLKQIIDLSQKHRKPVLVDPKEKHFSYYAGATVITPNRKEAFQAYSNDRGEDKNISVEDVGKDLMKRLNLKAVLITLGEDGMALFEKGKSMVTIPTAAREVYDVSGAGDTVIAVLSMAMAAGASMKEASIIANLAAGIVVGKLGTAVVTFKELRQAIENCPGTRNLKRKR
ncbi:MAG: D-glycero-beta-D-manno-heptose-7-phosphate kinase [Candidatus Omnitrophica bacterium]|nr:D-glycero-beta-D-manno-heptose-7-phosphate kinase [Candidatus Omnitrophota bacterium]